MRGEATASSVTECLACTDPASNPKTTQRERGERALWESKGMERKKKRLLKISKRNPCFVLYLMQIVPLDSKS